MPKTIYTQTFNVTLTSTTRDLQDQLAARLSSLNDVFSTTYDVVPGELESKEIDTAEDLRRNERNGKLLGLKGWLYGEYLKKDAGLASEWDQAMWGRETTCGTTCCIAGKIVLDAGGVFVGGTQVDPNRRNFFDARMPGEVDSVNIELKAAELLGLTVQEHTVLFLGSNTYETAVAVIDAIIAGEDVSEARDAVASY